MKLRKLEEALQHITAFKEPDYKLEQYPTSAHLASRILHTADSYGDIECCSVADLGCGTGMFAIGSQLLGASHSVGFDVSKSALELAKKNVLELDVVVDFVNVDISCPSFRENTLPFDTILMNPPFGTRTKGIDIVFLEAALALSRRAVYSLHKTSTRKFIVKKFKALGFNVEVLAELKFDIPQMYKFHRKKSVDVHVDLIRFEKALRKE